MIKAFVPWVPESMPTKYKPRLIQVSS